MARPCWPCAVPGAQPVVPLRTPFLGTACRAAAAGEIIAAPTGPPCLPPGVIAVLHSSVTRPARLATEVFVMFLIVSAAALSAADDSAKDLAAQAKAFIADAEKTLIPLEVAQGKAWWGANTTGTDQAYERSQEAQNKIDAVLSDREAFGRLKR